MDADALAMAEEARRNARQAALELKQTDAAFEGLRQAGIEALLACGAGEHAKTERLIVCLQTLDTVRKMLQMAVAQGDHANYALAWAEQNSLLRR